MQAGHIAAAPGQTGLCQGITTVPVLECGALIALFDATDGDNWQTNTNWRDMSSPTAPCDWAGLTCSGGHVTGLQLSANRLRGRLPAAVGALAGLTTLDLSVNRLFDQLPISVCRLADTVTNADFAYNQLTTFNQQVRTCMAQIDADWASTQTMPPLDLTVSAITTDSIQLTWRAILYQDDGGGYGIRLVFVAK